MKIVKVIALVSVIIGCRLAQAANDSLVKAFYAEASEAGKLGTPFDVASLDRILSPEFILNDGQLVRSQSQLKIDFAELKKRAGGWTISHIFSLPSIQDGACDRILFLWSVPGAKDLVVDAHLYSSTGKQLDKMVAAVMFKDACFKVLAEGFLQGLNQGFTKSNVVPGEVTLTFDPLTNSLVFACVVVSSLGKKFNLAVTLSEAQEKSDKKNA